MALLPRADTLVYNSVEKVKKYWDTFKPDTQLTYKDKWLANAPLFESISTNKRVCIALWETLDPDRFFYAVDNTRVLGEHAKHLTDANGIDYSMSKFYPDHLNSVLNMQLKAAEFWKRHPGDLPNHITINMDSAYKKDGDYIHILQQASIVEVDENNNPLIFLSFIYDITHLKKAKSANLVVTSSSDYELWNYNLDKKALEKVTGITTREMSILKHLAGGKRTKEIAEGLQLSPLTVDTHRRNLLAKTNCMDTTAMVTYCRMVGLI